MKSLVIVSSWFAVAITALGVSLWTYSWTAAASESKVLGESTARPAEKHLAAYAAVPDEVTELKTAVKAKDGRPVVVENYLTKFKSPMAGQGEFIVAKAKELGNKFEVDPTYLSYLTIAIAQNESNLGKKMPPNCHNAWGYGIHSAGTLCFGSWEEGISRFMTGVAEDFIAKRGLETPEEIMTRYTPHSPNGIWAKSVKSFLEDLYAGG
jgi:hypothetical protein